MSKDGGEHEMAAKRLKSLGVFGHLRLMADGGEQVLCRTTDPGLKYSIAGPHRAARASPASAAAIKVE
jgi:hypothetical protein